MPFQPYQLGFAGDKNESTFENPADAEEMKVPLQAGDLIVMASDGLFDNLPESALLELLQQGVSAGKEVSAIAQDVVDAAVEAALDKSTDSPFAILAKDNDILWSGGRPDDITVLVGRAERLR